MIRSGRNIERKTVVKGTGSDEVREALAQFGYEMSLKETFMAPGAQGAPDAHGRGCRSRATCGPTISSPCTRARQGHWILVKGVKMCDTFTEGRWTFVVDGPHRGARLMEVFEVRKSLGV